MMTKTPITIPAIDFVGRPLDLDLDFDEVFLEGLLLVGSSFPVDPPFSVVSSFPLDPPGLVLESKLQYLEPRESVLHVSMES